MPRKGNKGVHTSPQTAGRQNMDWNKISKMRSVRKDEFGMGDKIIDVMKMGELNYQKYSGKWTEETLKHSIAEFFDYCAEVQMRPSKPLLLLWLNLTKSTFSEWINNPSKYQYKSNLLKKAMLVIESHLEQDIYKYPTGAIFLLKTSHGHIETSKLDVTTNDKTVTDADEVKDMIAKMGLDKK